MLAMVGMWLSSSINLVEINENVNQNNIGLYNMPYEKSFSVLSPL